ncbi:hypothetical protein LT85_4272 [Collimonas arenae]|uniref:Uncharacterized protein n=1 Tax=Collimonas arenae TaxID=279058 RepID=A0A0A1FI94_9BURK|nr:hypothetical protein [Collimonas arenae]AIY43430.1 hypothetical protein LT85_4272 [Collimonas arenae]
MNKLHQVTSIEPSLACSVIFNIAKQKLTRLSSLVFFVGIAFSLGTAQRLLSASRFLFSA